MSGTRQPDQAAGTVLRGQVLLVERLGGTSHIHFEVGTNRLLVVAAGEQLPAVGEAVELWLPADRVHLFRADGRVAGS